MDEQADKANHYTYDGRTDRQGQSIYIRWTNKRNKAINIRPMAGDRQGQSIYLRWPKTEKGNQYTYDGRKDRLGKSIYLRWTNR